MADKILQFKHVDIFKSAESIKTNYLTTLSNSDRRTKHLTLYSRRLYSKKTQQERRSPSLPLNNLIFAKFIQLNPTKNLFFYFFSLQFTPATNVIIHPPTILIWKLNRKTQNPIKIVA